MKPVRLAVGLIGAGVLVCTTGCGLTASPRSEGYADFDAPYYNGMERDAAISLGPRVLRFAARHADEDPGAKALLRAIDGVRVSSYQFTDEVDRNTLARPLSARASDLAADDWQTIVHVQENEKTVLVLVKENDRSIKGVTVLTANTRELVFVNVMGKLSAHALARIAEKIPGEETLAFITARIK